MSIINPVPVNGEFRRPRGIVRIGGTRIDGWTQFEVENNAYYAADTFNVTFSMSALPGEYSVTWWALQTSMGIELLAGFPEDPSHYDVGELKSLILGAVDEIRFNFDSQTIEVTGRDYTSKFIDTKTTEKWPNKKPHEIAQILAARHGMLANVDAVSQLAGTFYEIDHIVLTDERSEWDLLTWLAAQSQRRVWVSGNTLYFKALPTANDDKYLIQWNDLDTERGYYQSSTMTLDVSRNLNIAKGVTVQVRSWNMKSKRAFTVQYPKRTKGATPGSGSLDAQVYSYNIPGLTHEGALQRAQALYQQIIAHEFNLSVSMQADNLLDISHQIELRGTGSAFDAIYYPDAITRSLSLSGGYEMHIKAKNHSPESVVSL